VAAQVGPARRSQVRHSSHCTRSASAPTTMSRPTFSS